MLNYEELKFYGAFEDRESVSIIIQEHIFDI